MDLVNPALGLIFWQVVIFLLVLFFLSRFAWKPILNALKDRENSIEEALKSAEKARSEVQQMTSQNEKLLDEARHEKDRILKEAYKVAEETKNEARERATIEYNKMLEDARKAIENEKTSAITEIKKQIAILSVEVAEKILKKQLEDQEKQTQLASDLIKDLELN